MFTTTASPVDRFITLVDHIDAKNNGGCLFFCLAFYRWLKQEGLPTDSFEIIQYAADFEERCVEQNINWPEVRNGAESSSHFTWMYEGVEYDAFGEVTEDRKTHKIFFPDNRVVLAGLNTDHVCLVEEFCIDALNNSGWNYMFDRNAAVDELNSMGIEMEDVRR